MSLTVELTKEMLIDMVKGTGGPGNYTKQFDHVGNLSGFPNEKWYWNETALRTMSDGQLLNLYRALKQEI